MYFNLLLSQSGIHGIHYIMPEYCWKKGSIFWGVYNDYNVERELLYSSLFIPSVLPELGRPGSSYFHPDTPV